MNSWFFCGTSYIHHKPTVYIAATFVHARSFLQCFFFNQKRTLITVQIATTYKSSKRVLKMVGSLENTLEIKAYFYKMDRTICRSDMRFTAQYKQSKPLIRRNHPARCTLSCTKYLVEKN